MGWLLNFRVRAAAYFALIVPIVLLAPARGRGFQTLASPLGAGLLAILLFAGGAIVGDLGGSRAVRRGVLLRVGAAVMLIASLVLAYAGARRLRLERVEAWAWVVLAVAFAHVLYGVVSDLGIVSRPRR